VLAGAVHGDALDHFRGGNSILAGGNWLLAVGDSKD
jgi:hypothetical protein